MSLLILGSTLPATTADATTRRVCAKSAIVRDTPRGFAIARVYRGQRVRVVRASGAPGWTPIRTSLGLPGWILSSRLCRG